MKKLLLGIGAVGLAMYYFGNRKVTEVRSVVDQLKLQVNGIRNLNVSSGGIKFKIDLNIQNPTNQPLTLNTAQLVTLSKLRFFAPNGDFIGESFPNISDISIPAYGSISVPNLDTFVKVSNIGHLFNNVLQLFAEPSSLKVQAELSALGQTYTI
ncbi:hypothetical protein [Aquimarina litoralis]|uniref:hypothetical protein n=1 Tax=Aquimarina litoralis TaxID=584605 RepID=UPI001C59C853|nr:hypothetical protein [Aquimarina litoralis]MBW1297822.1 hypothetical protein [Aquimarina litoralis]